jgi:hypothetical protein
VRIRAQTAETTKAALGGFRSVSQDRVFVDDDAAS